MIESNPYIGDGEIVQAKDPSQFYIIRIRHDDPDLIEKIDRVCVNMIVNGEMQAARNTACAYHMRFSLIVKRNSEKITFEMLKQK